MTLSEAIIHAESEAWKNSREADRCFRHGGSAYDERAKSCKACANEHRQLAEWLKELRAYRETYPYGVDRFNGSDTPQTECRTCKWAGVSWTSHYCDDCKGHNKYEPNDTPQAEEGANI